MVVRRRGGPARGRHCHRPGHRPEAPGGPEAQSPDSACVSRFLLAVVTSAVAVSAVVLLATTGVLGESWSQVVDDLGQLAAGLFAAASCGITWRTAVRAGQTRSAWLWRGLLFLGTFGWTCGQAIWSWYQLVAHRELPSPSLADVGYFALPVFALPGVLALPAAPAPRVLRGGVAGELPRGERRGRALLGLDAVVIVGSLFLLTWSTALGAVVDAGAPTMGALLIALGYPVTDVILVVIVLLTAVFRRPRRPLALVLLGAGLVALSVSDSFFLYLVSVGATAMPPLYNIGFLAGPVLIGLAALAPDPAPPPRRGAARSSARAATWFTLVPYLPLGVIGLLVVVQQSVGSGPEGTEIYGLILLVGIVVFRQLLTTLENLDLVRRVQESQDRLHHQAFHDSLTGLPNRALFHERLVRAVERHQRDGRRLALLFCDLDDFKHVNDTRGHPAGDELLRVTADRLRQCTQPSDTVARLGGDEFAVILDDDDQATPLDVAQRMLAALSEPVLLAGQPHVPRASAGLAVVEPGDQEVTAPLLLHHADAAMYVAKRGGKGQLVSYGPEVEADLSAADAGSALARALAEVLASASTPVPRSAAGGLNGSPHGAPVQGQDPAAAVRLAYQPIVRLSDGRMVAVEALARWQHPQSGDVPPELLIRVAEGCGLINQLEDRILELACRDIALIRAGRPGMAVHVNIGASRVTDPLLVGRVRRVLRRHQLPGEALVLEVTEGGRIGDLPTAAQVLNTLRRLGVRVALDDFGTGNNNLAYLLQLPIDILKLDRTLTGHGPHSGRVQMISAGTVQIGRWLGIQLIAEGVELREQADRLAGFGCEFGQGYLFSRPVPVEDLMSIPHPTSR